MKAQANGGFSCNYEQAPSAVRYCYYDLLECIFDTPHFGDGDLGNYSHSSELCRRHHGDQRCGFRFLDVKLSRVAQMVTYTCPYNDIRGFVYVQGSMAINDDGFDCTYQDEIYARLRRRVIYACTYSAVAGLTLFIVPDGFTDGQNPYGQFACSCGSGSSVCEYDNRKLPQLRALSVRKSILNIQCDHSLRLIGRHDCDQ
ncbi:hypothetical protein RQP46_010842 [Phenoliferia psychrophenolica]